MGSIYNSSTWETIVGRIESDGSIYDGIGMFAKLIGRVDGDGRLYDDVRFFGRLVGSVKDNGEIYNYAASSAAY